MQLMTFQAVIAFLPRCSISRRVVDQAAARAVNVLTMRLTDSAWSRILTELLTAQVFTQPANSLNELHAFMRDAIFPAPARLEIVADDWHHAEAFAMPTGTDAAAVAARQQLEPIQFLSLVNALDVEEPMALLPLSLFSTIVAFVGPCLTQAARRTGASSVQLAASILRVHLASTACTDAQLAAKVAPLRQAKECSPIKSTTSVRLRGSAAKTSRTALSIIALARAGNLSRKSAFSSSELASVPSQLSSVMTCKLTPHVEATTRACSPPRGDMLICSL